MFVNRGFFDQASEYLELIKPMHEKQ